MLKLAKNFFASLSSSPSEPGGGSILLFRGNGLNLAEDALGQILHRHAGAGGLGGEEFGVDLVESGEVTHVGQKAGGLEDLAKANAGALQNGTHVLAALLRLAMPSGTAPVAGSTGIWPEV